MKRAGIALVALAAMTITTPGIALAADPGVPTTLDVAVDGARPNDRSFGGSSVSADGRYVAFTSFASNLVANDTNGRLDVFVRDTATGTTTIASVGSDGSQATAPSSEPSISADGRYVAFQTSAPDLVPGDTNDDDDVFVRDLRAGTTTRVSVTAAGRPGGWHDGSQYPSISADGRYVAFETESKLVSSDTDYQFDVYVYDRETARPERVSAPAYGRQSDRANYGTHARISADGRYVVFHSDATNLTYGDVNGKQDVFVRDRNTQRTSLVSISESFLQGNEFSDRPSLSDDGRYVAFTSMATNFPNGTDGANRYRVYVKDLVTGRLIREDRNTAGQYVFGYEAQISGNGRYLAMQADPGITEGSTGGLNIYVRDRQSGEVTPASHGYAGAPAVRTCLDIALSADGRHVAFTSDDGTLAPDDNDRRDNTFFATLTS
jgi:Tol biopolymer transport system component